MREEPTRLLELDARRWTKILDFYEALLAALGAPEFHGHSMNALIDSMIWGGINAVEPPYTIRISGTEILSEEIRCEIEVLKMEMKKAREQHGVDIRIDTASR